VGQHTPLLQVSPVAQQAEPHTWAVGQQTPVAAHVSPEAQQADPQTWPAGQQMALAPVPMQVWAGVAPLVWQQVAAAPVPQQVSLVPQQD